MYLVWIRHLLLDVVHYCMTEDGVSPVVGIILLTAVTVVMAHQILERMWDDGYQQVKTTTIVSTAMEQVLGKNGFERVFTEEPVDTDIPDRVRDELSDDYMPTKETVN